MGALASFFPLLVVVATVALIVFLIRLDRRLSRGALSAGPRSPARAEPPGLQQTPWELKAIDDQLLASPGHQARSDLTKTVNRLIQAAGVDDPGRLLPPNASDHEIGDAISRLEQQLELPPLMPPGFPPTDPPVPGVGPDRLGSVDR
jgi:hypothetical protein